MQKLQNRQKHPVTLKDRVQTVYLDLKDKRTNLVKPNCSVRTLAAFSARTPALQYTIMGGPLGDGFTKPYLVLNSSADRRIADSMSSTIHTIHYSYIHSF